jgi:hypothetical protein
MNSFKYVLILGSASLIGAGMIMGIVMQGEVLDKEMQKAAIMLVMLQQMIFAIYAQAKVNQLKEEQIKFERGAKELQKFFEETP